MWYSSASRGSSRSRRKSGSPASSRSPLLPGEAGGALAAQAVHLELLLQLQPVGIISVVPQAELLPAVHPVQLLPEGGVIGGVQIQAGHPVGAVRPRVLIVGKQAAQPPGEHQILRGRDLVLELVAHGGGLSRPSHRRRHRRPNRRHHRPSRRCRRGSRSRWGPRTSRRHRNR